MKVLFSIIVVVALALGGAGVTVAAAQYSLPDEGLYPVKTWSEDARLQMTGDEQARLELLLGFIDRRVVEAHVLTQAGQDIPQAVADRYQTQSMQAFQIAAGMDDATIIQALEQLQTRLEIHDRDMDKLQTNQPDHASPVLAQMRETVRERVQLAELGLGEPNTFRLHLRPGAGEPATSAPGGPPEATPQPGGGNGPGPQAGTGTATPMQDGSGPGPGPQPGTTSQPGGNPEPGNGPGSSSTATPPMDGTGNGPGPQPQETSGPGQGSGNGGDPACTATPPMDGTGNGPGPQPQQTSGPGQGNGNGPQSTPTPGAGSGAGGNGGG